MKTLEKVYWLRFGFGILAAFVAIMFLVLSGAINTNLLLNPSVEVGNTGASTPQHWSSSGNGAEWSVTYAKTGSRSLRIDVVNDSGEWIANVESVSGGNTYEISGFFFGQVSNGQFLLTVRWFSTSGLLGEGNVTLPSVNYSTWQSLETGFSAPSGTRSCEIVFRAVNATGDVYADNFEVRHTESNQSFFNSASIAIIVYAVTYYAIKPRFAPQLQKPQKLLTAGIGIYFLSWIVFWTLLYTILAGVL